MISHFSPYVHPNFNLIPALVDTEQAVCTLIIVVYNLVATMAVPAMYNYWAILGLDIFGVVFWLVSFALLASEVAAYEIVTYTYDTSSCNYYYAGVCYKKRSLNFLAKRVATTDVYTYRNALAAASGLGGLELYALQP